jgi:hypothetical protein
LKRRESGVISESAIRPATYSGHVQLGGERVG